MQSAIISCLDKKGAESFKKMLNDLGGGSSAATEPEVEKTQKGRSAKPHVPVPKGPKDHRVPAPPKRRTKEDILK